MTGDTANPGALPYSVRLLILEGTVPKIVAAIPPAIAGIATSVASAYNWHGNWVRFGATALALSLAKLRYETRHLDEAGVPMEPEMTQLSFVDEIAAIVGEEANQWRVEMKQGVQTAGSGGPAIGQVGPADATSQGRGA